MGTTDDVLNTIDHVLEGDTSRDAMRWTPLDVAEEEGLPPRRAPSRPLFVHARETPLPRADWTHAVQELHAHHTGLLLREWVHHWLGIGRTVMFAYAGLPPGMGVPPPMSMQDHYRTLSDEMLSHLTTKPGPVLLNPSGGIEIFPSDGVTLSSHRAGLVVAGGSYTWRVLVDSGGRWVAGPAQRL